jgi:hypothetical protein
MFTQLLDNSDLFLERSILVISRSSDMQSKNCVSFDCPSRPAKIQVLPNRAILVAEFLLHFFHQSLIRCLGDRVSIHGSSALGPDFVEREAQFVFSGS